MPRLFTTYRLVRWLKIILLLLVTCSLSLVSAPPVHAKTGDPVPPHPQEDTVTVSDNYEGSVLTSFIAGLDIMLFEGCKDKNSLELNKILSLHYLAEVALETHIFKCSDALNGQGLLNVTTNAMAAVITTPPASAGEYLADVGSRLGVTPAYAQAGYGAKSLVPVLPIWRAFRNVTYVFYILIFVLVGLMIMFRSKINPQTVVTIQAAIPNLVITLLLITFSYAIAGFLIDLMYWAIYLIIFLFEATGLLQPGQAQYTITDVIFNHNLVGLRGVIGDSQELVRKALGAIWSPLGTYFGLIGWLVFGFFVLISMIKAVIELIKTYLTIILYVITAPLQIILNAMPGSEAFLQWLRCLVGNLAVFPAVVGFIMIGAALIGNANTTPGTGGLVDSDFFPKFADGVGYTRSDPANPNPPAFIPPLIIKQGRDSMGNFPAARQEAIEVIQGLLGMALILLLPATIGLVKETFGCKMPDLGRTIEQNWGEGQGYFDKTINTATTWGSRGVSSYYGYKYGGRTGWRRILQTLLNLSGINLPY